MTKTICKWQSIYKFIKYNSLVSESMTTWQHSPKLHTQNVERLWRMTSYQQRIRYDLWRRKYRLFLHCHSRLKNVYQCVYL